MYLSNNQWTVLCVSWYYYLIVSLVSYLSSRDRAEGVKFYSNPLWVLNVPNSSQGCTSRAIICHRLHEIHCNLALGVLRDFARSRWPFWKTSHWKTSWHGNASHGLCGHSTCHPWSITFWCVFFFSLNKLLNTLSSWRWFETTWGSYDVTEKYCFFRAIVPL